LSPEKEKLLYQICNFTLLEWLLVKVCPFCQKSGFMFRGIFLPLPWLQDQDIKDHQILEY
jgi:hypothetical protein